MHNCSILCQLLEVYQQGPFYLPCQSIEHYPYQHWNDPGTKVSKIVPLVGFFNFMLHSILNLNLIEKQSPLTSMLIVTMHEYTNTHIEHWSTSTFNLATWISRIFILETSSWLSSVTFLFTLEMSCLRSSELFCGGWSWDVANFPHRGWMENWGSGRYLCRSRTRGDLDTTRHLVLHRISIKKKVHGQWDISTTGHIIIECDGRL